MMSYDVSKKGPGNIETDYYTNNNVINPAETAFSAQSDIFDENESHNPVAHWQRMCVRKHVEKYLFDASSMLEINAGTGQDAIYFAQKGLNVLATDASIGMTRVASQKAKNHKGPGSITVQQCSFKELHNLPSILQQNKHSAQSTQDGNHDISPTGKVRFDYVLSNFGGLNCINDTTEVSNALYTLLNPGASVTIVMLSPICPWELASVFTGNFKKAFRRLRKNGTTAVIEGVPFKAWYPSAKQVEKTFTKDFKFKLLELQGLSFFSPPPYKPEFPKKYPKTWRMLTKLDDKVSHLPLFNRWGDYYIMTFKRI